MEVQLMVEPPAAVHVVSVIVCADAADAIRTTEVKTRATLAMFFFILSYHAVFLAVCD